MLAQQFEALLAQNETLQSALDRLPKLELPDYYLGAGFIAQTVWNIRSGRAPTADVKDVDLVYFDGEDRSASAEQRVCERANELLHDVLAQSNLTLDVTNEARVHLWYEDAFGVAIAPYTSTADAIETWPSTASAIGVRRESGQLKICAPFGLDDLLQLVVRPNKKLIPQQVYESKIARWKRCWPKLTVIPW